MGGLQNSDALRRLANGSAELRRNLKKEFAAAAGDVARKAQARILAADSGHPGPLRAEIAATVGVRGRYTQTGWSAEIKSDGEKMPPGKKNLPAYADAAYEWRRWRHPVFARRVLAGGVLGPVPKSSWTWVSQTWPSAEGWFYETIDHDAQSFSDAVQSAMDETSRYLEGR